MERAKEIADARDTTVEALRSQAIAAYIEEQQDIVYAKETLAKIRSGEVQPLTREEIAARLSGGFLHAGGSTEDLSRVTRQ